MISVIIPTKNRAEAVINAVASVFSAGKGGEFELFVVDQSTDDETENQLTAHFADKPQFHYYRNDKPGVGAASSRNIGIALSSGEILAIIDDDVSVQPDWMANIVSEFGSDPKLDFVCGKLTAPEMDWTEGFTPSFNADTTLTKYQMPIEAAGANFSMRRRLLDRIGGYDECCGPGSILGASDDGDLTWRIVRSGAKWRICPHIEVVHTFGFRKTADGASLLKRYQVGLGGNFGRFTRRGDIFAAFHFALWQLKDAVKGTFLLLRGRRDSGLGWVKDRVIGFFRGLALSPSIGFVSGADLRQLKSDLTTSSRQDSRLA